MSFRPENLLFFAVACCALAGSLAHHAAADEPDRPNVLLMISDDQCWTDYAVMGHLHVQTPHLDRLADQSVVYTRGYVPTSLCRPSLATIMSGLFPHQHGIVGNDPPPPADQPDMVRQKSYRTAEYGAQIDAFLQHVDRMPKLPAIMAKVGYTSFQAGKWWEGHYSRGGFTQGMTHGDRQRGARHGDAGLTIGRQGVAELTAFMDAQVAARQPFLAYYAPMLPHDPHDPPAELLNKYLPLAPSESIARYWAMCEFFDSTCGAVLQHLDKLGVANQTLVVYVTDNGWITDPTATRYAPKSKRSPYDGGTRTPIMIRWPGKVEPRRDEQHLASSIDIVPTILTAIGAADRITPEMQGIDLLNQSAVDARHMAFGEIFEHDVVEMDNPVSSLQYRWVIEDDWKLILPDTRRLSTATPELYKLSADPTEIKNLAADHPELVESLTEKLNKWWPAQELQPAN